MSLVAGGHVPVADVSVATLFNIAAPAKVTVPVFAPNKHVPQSTADYCFRPEILRVLLLMEDGMAGNNLYLSGPAGAGKTSVIEQMAARVNRGVLRVAGHGRFQAEDLVGRWVLSSKKMTENGVVQLPQPEMDFHYGPLPIALKEGHILLIDEVDLIPPNVTMGLNSVLDGAPLFIPETGETIVPHPNFRLVVTGNTNGTGDTSKVHFGTVRQNLAWLDRFIALPIGYMLKTEELPLVLKKAPAMPEQMASAMVDIANEVRALFIGQHQEGAFNTSGQFIDATFSTRTLMRWVSIADAFQKTKVKKPINAALQLALLNRVSPVARVAIVGIARRVLGNDLIDE